LFALPSLSSRFGATCVVACGNRKTQPTDFLFVRRHVVRPRSGGERAVHSLFFVRLVVEVENDKIYNLFAEQQFPVP